MCAKLGIDLDCGMPLRQFVAHIVKRSREQELELLQVRMMEGCIQTLDISGRSLPVISMGSSSVTKTNKEITGIKLEDGLSGAIQVYKIRNCSDSELTSMKQIRERVQNGDFIGIPIILREEEEIIQEYAEQEPIESEEYDDGDEDFEQPEKTNDDDDEFLFNIPTATADPINAVPVNACIAPGTHPDSEKRKTKLYRHEEHRRTIHTVYYPYYGITFNLNNTYNLKVKAKEDKMKQFLHCVSLLSVFCSLP